MLLKDQGNIGQFKFSPHNHIKIVTSHTVFKDLLPPDAGSAPETKNLTSENNNHK